GGYGSRFDCSEDLTLILPGLYGIRSVESRQLERQAPFGKCGPFLSDSLDTRRSHVNASRNSQSFCPFTVPEASALCHRVWGSTNAGHAYVLAPPDSVVADEKFSAPRVLLFGSSDIGMDQCGHGFTGWNRIFGDLRDVGVPGIQGTTRYSLSLDVSGFWS